MAMVSLVRCVFICHLRWKSVVNVYCYKLLLLCYASLYNNFDYCLLMLPMCHTWVSYRSGLIWFFMVPCGRWIHFDYWYYICLVIPDNDEIGWFTIWSVITPIWSANIINIVRIVYLLDIVRYHSVWIIWI